MIRKVLMLALTTGLASKLYRNYRQKQGAMGDASGGRMQGGTASGNFDAPRPGTSGAGMEV